MVLSQQREFLIPVPIKSTASRRQLSYALDHCNTLLSSLLDGLRAEEKPVTLQSPTKPEKQPKESKDHPAAGLIRDLKDKDIRGEKATKSPPPGEVAVAHVEVVDPYTLATQLRDRFKELNGIATNITAPLIYYSMQLTSLLLKNPEFVTELGFTWRERVEAQHPGKEFSVKPITSKMGLEMGVIRAFNVTMRSQKEHQDAASRPKTRSTTLYAGYDAPLGTLMERLQSMSIEVPPERDGGSPVTYKVTRVSEVRGRTILPFL